MPKKSAGILLYRKKSNTIEVFLVHPGGPFFQKKDEGAWSIPKGEFEDGEIPLNAAIREFEEETGEKISGNFIELTPIKQKSGKIVFPWALEGDLSSEVIKSNNFTLEWPPKSGKIQEFPEIDKAEWFPISKAKIKINATQFAIVEELLSKLNIKSSEQSSFNKPNQLDLF